MGNPSKEITDNMIKVQGGRMYLPVAWRVVWFRKEHPDWGITTRKVGEGEDWAEFEAMIHNDKGQVLATAHKREDRRGFGDYLEKAETGAIGRALAFAGYGTQFDRELDEDPEKPLLEEKSPQYQEERHPGRPPQQRQPSERTYQDVVDDLVDRALETGTLADETQVDTRTKLQSWLAALCAKEGKPLGGNGWPSVRTMNEIREEMR